MRKGLSIILLLFGLAAELAAQEVISADTQQGCDSLLVSFSLQNAGALSSYSSVIWDFDDGDTAMNTLAPSHLFAPGTYSVSCQFDGSRTITLSGDIEVRNSPVAVFTWKDSTVTEGTLGFYFESTAIPGTGEINTYYWEFEDGTSYTTAAFLKEFSEQGVVELMHVVRDDLGCADTLIDRIAVSETLLVSNVFSPNGDGINDYFEVSTNGEVLYRLTIFSRTGSIIYQSASPRIFWDGRTFSGKEVPVGVYFYIIESAVEGVTEMTGFIHLYR